MQKIRWCKGLVLPRKLTHYASARCLVREWRREIEWVLDLRGIAFREVQEMTAPTTTVARGQFRNEPATDFAKPENRRAMEAALGRVAGELGREYPLIVGGERIETAEKIRSLNPSRPSQVVGIFQKGTAELANRAVEAAYGAFERWKRVPAEERAECLFRAAGILRQRKLDIQELSAFSGEWPSTLLFDPTGWSGSLAPGRTNLHGESVRLLRRVAVR